MKATRYFSDYQSAYNYYGGNVVPSTEIALIGDGSYIFVSSDNAVSGNQQYFDVSMTNDEIVDTMTYTAYNNGVSYGEAVGFETGYTAGTTYGEAIGYAQGYEGGYSYGYSYGYSEGEAAGGSGEYEDIYVLCSDITELFATVDEEGSITADYINVEIDQNFSKSYETLNNVTTYTFSWDFYNEHDNDYDAKIKVVGEFSDSEEIDEDHNTVEHWFENFLDENGDFIEDLYGEDSPWCGFVAPILNDVTITPSQEVGYDYEIHFNHLIYQNHLGSSQSLTPQEITENGIYPNTCQAYFNVNVESGSSLTDLTLLERGKYITDRGINHSNPYSWQFVYQINSSYCLSVFNQYPDPIPEVFGDNVDDHWTIYKISSNEVSRITDYDNGVHGFEVDHETGDIVINEGDYGYINVDLEAGDKVGFWYENMFLLSINPATNLNDHWFEIETTGTYMLKYEVTNWVEDPETGDGYWEVEGSFELVQE